MIQEFYNKLSEKEKKMFLGAVLFAVLALFDLLFLRPVLSRLKTIDGDVVRMENNIKQDIRFLSYEDKIYLEEKGFRVFQTDEYQEEDKIIANFLGTVELLASESEIRLVKLNPSDILARKGSVQYYANLECVGRLKNIITFIHKIDSTKNLLKVVKFNMAGNKASAEEVQASMKVAKLVIDPKTIGNYEFAEDDLTAPELVDAEQGEAEKTPAVPPGKDAEISSEEISAGQEQAASSSKETKDRTKTPASEETPGEAADKTSGVQQKGAATEQSGAGKTGSGGVAGDGNGGTKGEGAGAGSGGTAGSGQGSGSGEGEGADGQGAGGEAQGPEGAGNDGTGEEGEEFAEAEGEGAGGGTGEDGGRSSGQGGAGDADGKGGSGKGGQAGGSGVADNSNFSGGGSGQGAGGQFADDGKKKASAEDSGEDSGGGSGGYGAGGGAGAGGGVAGTGRAARSGSGTFDDAAAKAGDERRSFLDKTGQQGTGAGGGGGYGRGVGTGGGGGAAGSGSSAGGQGIGSGSGGQGGGGRTARGGNLGSASNVAGGGASGSGDAQSGYQGGSSYGSGRGKATGGDDDHGRGPSDTTEDFALSGDDGANYEAEEEARRKSKLTSRGLSSSRQKPSSEPPTKTADPRNEMQKDVADIQKGGRVQVKSFTQLWQEFWGIKEPEPGERPARQLTEKEIEDVNKAAEEERTKKSIFQKKFGE